MKLRRSGHLRNQTIDKGPQRVDLLTQLNNNLFGKYNSADKFHYLKEILQLESNKATPISISSKDYKTLDNNQQILHQFVPRQEQPGILTETVLYYRYYDDAPRVFIQSVHGIITGYLEANRLRKYTQLKHLFQDRSSTTEMDVLDSFSDFVPLLAAKNHRNDNTLLVLKKELDRAFEDSPLDFLPCLDLTPVNFTFLQIRKWEKCTGHQRLSEQYQTKALQNLRRSSGQICLRTQPNDDVRQGENEFPRYKASRMRTINSVQKLVQQIQNRPVVTFRNVQPGQKQLQSSRQSRSPQSRNPSYKHTRIRSEQLAKELPLNHYIASVLSFHNLQKLSRLRKKRTIPTPSRSGPKAQRV